MVVWTVFLALITCVWASRHLAIRHAQRTVEKLSAVGCDGWSEDPPFVSFLVAAKDEQDNIEVAVRTLLEQDYPAFEVIVINDRSTDRTAEILQRLHSEQPDGRLKVLHISKLQKGWFGKNNAMREGVAAARGQWLCFGDADCRQTSPHSLSAAIRYVTDNKVDFLSVLPNLENRTTWERIIQPACGALLVFWFPPMRVNDPACKEAYANGAFMLLSRDCYDAIGGHEAVRTEVNEDMHMARLCKENGRRLRVIQNDGLYTVRMYTDFNQMWHGWSRIFYGCFGTFRRLAVSIRMLVLMNVFPYVSFLIALGVLLSRGWADLSTGWRGVLIASTAAVATQQSVIARFYKLSRVHPAWAPTFIVGAVVCIGMLTNAIRRLRGRSTTTWRGTTYRADEVLKTR
jgi:chlorobactene glucosyltransferase